VIWLAETIALQGIGISYRGVGLVPSGLDWWLSILSSPDGGIHRRIRVSSRIRVRPLVVSLQMCGLAVRLAGPYRMGRGPVVLGPGLGLGLDSSTCMI
jgi:hypothetical protein